MRFFLLFFTLVFPFLLNAQTAYKQTVNGILFVPDKRMSGGAKAVRLEVINDKIIRVTASPTETFSEKESLVTIYKPSIIKFEAKQEGNNVILETANIKSVADLSSGSVKFYNKGGVLLVSEPDVNGRELKPAYFEGEQLLSLRQSFNINKDELIAGLGQHQEDAWNYNNRQVTLFQNNTQVAIPFMVSNKGYGILWHNYALTTAGNTNEILPLSALKISDKTGNTGWLTATYANDRNRPGEILLDTPYSEISFPYVTDSKTKLPKSFRPETGVVTWEGSIGSNAGGKQTLKVAYAGYVKIWLDGKLVFDKWRQAWNPGSGIVETTIEPGSMHPIKIEWIPDGGESYLNIGYLPPLTGNMENTFSFKSEAGRETDYYFVYGESIDEVIGGYRYLTGKAPIVPRWAMGFWQSRERYKTQEELLSTVATFRNKKIPLDNIVLDWFYWRENNWGSQQFDSTRFPDARGMINKLHKEYKTKLLISVWPKFYEGSSTYKAFLDSGYLYTRNIADRQKDWVGPGYTSTFYDAFNPKARTAFWNLINDRIFKLGVDAWWMDASEPDILSNVSPERRKSQMMPNYLGTAAEYLNAYPLQNAKGIYEGQRSVKPNQRVFLLTRSGFAGSQRYAATIWSGDIASRWEDMKAQISAGINFSVSGLPYWTMDIGGFSVERRYEKPNEADLKEWRELQTRWYQFGAFVPLFRVHGQYPYREIFNIADEGTPPYESMLYYNNLRYKLLPYIYSIAGDAYHHDYTIMRPLVMDFAKDMKAATVGDQYMFGPFFLINPVYEYGSLKRNVYLPSGQGWYEAYSGKFFDGGQTINADAPYERMPLFIKEGAVFPSGPSLQYSSEKPADPLTISVYAGQNGSFNLYEDEGTNYDYESGKFTSIIFNWDEASKTLTIGKRNGSFKGMLQKRKFRIILIDKENPLGIGWPGFIKEVNYTGSLQKIILK